MLTPLEEPIDELSDLSKSEWDNLVGWESELHSEPFSDTSRLDRECIADAESLVPGFRTGHFQTKYFQCGYVLSILFLSFSLLSSRIIKLTNVCARIHRNFVPSK